MIPGPAPVITIQSRCGQRGGDVARLDVERIVGSGAGGAEDRDLAGRAVRREHVERVPHLLERRVGDLEVAAVGAVAAEAHGRRDQLEHEVGVVGIGDAIDDVGDGRVELGRRRCGTAGRAASIASPTVHRVLRLGEQRRGQLGQRRLRTGAEVTDHLGRRERAEPPGGAEIVAVREPEQEARPRRGRRRRWCRPRWATGCASMTCTSSRVTITAPFSLRVSAAISQRIAMCCSASSNESTSYSDVISASLANKTSTSASISSRNSARWRSTQKESDSVNATRLPGVVRGARGATERVLRLGLVPEVPLEEQHLGARDELVVELGRSELRRCTEERVQRAFRVGRDDDEATPGGCAARSRAAS